MLVNGLYSGVGVKYGINTFVGVLTDLSAAITNCVSPIYSIGTFVSSPNKISQTGVRNTSH